VCGEGIEPLVETPPVDAGPPENVAYEGPPIGAIRWDAWTNDPTLSWWSATGLDKIVPSGSKFNFRKPSLWDDFRLYGPGVDTQRIVDAEIASAKGRLDFWLYDWYPPAEVLAGTGDETPHSDILKAFEAHYASTHKADVKFAFLLPYFWMMHPGLSGSHFHAACEWIASRVRDDAYQRIDGKPLIALYNDRDGGGWNGNPDRWTEFKDVIAEPVHAVSVNSVSMLASLGLQGNMIYGPNGADHSGRGRKGYAEQMRIDVAHDSVVPGAQQISSRTAVNDRRPLTREGQEDTTWWVDQPTQPEWFDSIRNAVPKKPKFIIIYSWNEIGEGGPGILPTIQEGTRYLDAIDWVRSGLFPATYTYAIDFSWLYVTTDGKWAYSFPGPPNVIGAHDGDEVISSTPGDYKEFSHSGLQEVHIHATKGPDRGKIDILQDCEGLQMVDLYAPATTVSTDVATIVFSGAPRSHMVRVTVRGDKNPASTSTQVGLDFAEVTYSPSAALP
jgi:hypothetical protein